MLDTSTLGCTPGSRRGPHGLEGNEAACRGPAGSARYPDGWRIAPFYGDRLLLQYWHDGTCRRYHEGDYLFRTKVARLVVEANFPELKAPATEDRNTLQAVAFAWLGVTPSAYDMAWKLIGIHGGRDPIEVRGAIFFGKNVILMDTVKRWSVGELNRMSIWQEAFDAAHLSTVRTIAEVEAMLVAEGLKAMTGGITETALKAAVKVSLKWTFKRTFGKLMRELIKFLVRAFTGAPFKAGLEASKTMAKEIDAVLTRKEVEFRSANPGRPWEPPMLDARDLKPAWVKATGAFVRTVLKEMLFAKWSRQWKSLEEAAQKVDPVLGRNLKQYLQIKLTERLADFYTRTADACVQVYVEARAASYRNGAYNRALLRKNLDEAFVKVFLDTGKSYGKAAVDTAVQDFMKTAMP